MFVNRVIKFANLREQVEPTSSGNRINEVYKIEFNDDGTQDLVVCDHVDTYEMIQSHAASVDLKKIIERCTITGDTSELYKTEGFYGDLVGFPKTRAEALQMLSDANMIWAKLPTSVKEKFDNDVNKFFASAFTEEWSKKLEIVKEDIKEEVKEVVENE